MRFMTVWRGFARAVPLALFVLSACGSSDPPASGSESATETSSAPEPAGSGSASAPAPTDGCARDVDCAPDHNCVPSECVPRGRAVTDQVCEETGPPIGRCACVEGQCQELRCAADADCVPNDQCAPTACVVREPGTTDSEVQACDETGPPIGPCVCVEGRCREE